MHQGHLVLHRSLTAKKVPDYSFQVFTGRWDNVDGSFAPLTVVHRTRTPGVPLGVAAVRVWQDGAGPVRDPAGGARGQDGFTRSHLQSQSVDTRSSHEMKTTKFVWQSWPSCSFHWCQVGGVSSRTAAVRTPSDEAHLPGDSKNAAAFSISRILLSTRGAASINVDKNWNATQRRRTEEDMIGLVWPGLV